MKSSLTPFIAQEEKDTPEIILDSEKGIFQFKGRSIPENAVSFFSPVLEWLNDYGTKPNSVTEVIFDLNYFNTASAKQIAKIMVTFEKLSKKSTVLIKWKYQYGDHDMMTEGLRYKELTDLDINIIEKKEQ